jgi:catechol 2,3-dioxygenase
MSHLLPDDTQLGMVSLQVANLDRSVAWYRDVLGAFVLERDKQSAQLGSYFDKVPLLMLTERVGAEPMPQRGRLGLFHVAWLMPNRAALGQFVAHLAAFPDRVGTANHLVSEALYLTDPDGLGVEVYVDRPRDQWTWAGGEVQMASLPLDLKELVTVGGGQMYTGLPEGVRIGHVHLHVGNLAESTAFYRDVIGFSLTQSSYPGAHFLAAGGYHHHLGTNVWAGDWAKPPAPADARLLHWTVLVPALDDVHAVAARAQQHGVHGVLTNDNAFTLDDPWGTRVVVRVA